MDVSTRHVNRISAEVPDGWAVMESAEFHGPDGIRITITAQPCPVELDTGQLADRHADLLADQLTGYVEDSLEPAVAFTGQAALRRELHFGTAEQPGRSIAVYLAANGAAYVASATGPADAIATHEPTITGIVERLALIGTPLVATTTGDDPAAAAASTPTPHGDQRPTPSAKAWAKLRDRWTSSTSTASTSDDHGGGVTFSADELLVISAAMGVGLFPSVNPMAFADLSDTERSAVGRALGRALVTRGVLDDVEGRLSPGSDAAVELIDVAVHPDLLTEIAHGSMTRPSVHALCVRPDAMVAIEPCGPFGRRISVADEGDLLERVVALASALLATDDGPVDRALHLARRRRRARHRADLDSGGQALHRGAPLLAARPPARRRADALTGPTRPLPPTGPTAWERRRPEGPLKRCR